MLVYIVVECPPPATKEKQGFEKNLKAFFFLPVLIYKNVIYHWFYSF